MRPPAGAWGGTRVARAPSARGWLADAVSLAGLAGIAFAIYGVSREWTGPLRQGAGIDLSPAALPL